MSTTVNMTSGYVYDPNTRGEAADIVITAPDYPTGVWYVQVKGMSGAQLGQYLQDWTVRNSYDRFVDGLSGDKQEVSTREIPAVLNALSDLRVKTTTVTTTTREFACYSGTVCTCVD